MRLLRIGCLLSTLHSASATLFGVDRSYNADTTTDLGFLTLPNDFEPQGHQPHAAASENYQVMDLDLDQVPPAYRDLMTLQQRDWHWNAAFAVAGAVAAATSLAAHGSELEVIRWRSWMMGKRHLENMPEIWKRARTVSRFNRAAMFAFYVTGGGSIGWCVGKVGNWASNIIGQSCIAGASKDAKQEKREEFYKKADREVGQ